MATPELPAGCEDDTIAKEHFSYYVNSYCVFDEDTKLYFSITMVLICVLGIALNVYLIKRLNAKVMYMVTPSKNPTYDETYCYLSVLQLKIVKVALYLLIFWSITRIAMVLMGPLYLNFFYTY